MICTGCIKFDGTACRLQPTQLAITDPNVHWCAQGQWQQWSERYNEMEPYFWGEWGETA